MTLARYHRQILLPGIGEDGQRRLLDSRVLLVGCGALGTMIADGLARAGVGRLTIVDRDTVELTNLQRQVLFDEEDVERKMPKAEAARSKISRINSDVVVDAHVDDFNHRNAERLTEGCDIILDGLDNFEARFLLNDLAVKHGLPYIYGGAVATGGMSMAILPHPRSGAGDSDARGHIRGRVRWTREQATPCLQCVFPEAPPPGTHATCDTAGVLGAAVATIAAHQVAQAIKLLVGRIDAVDRSLLTIDVWENTTRRFDVSTARRPGGCPCCGDAKFDYLDGETASAATTLCGRNAVQITPAERPTGDGLDLAELARRLANHGEFTHNGYLLHGHLHPQPEMPSHDDDGRFELTVFPDGRAIIKGTTEVETARSLYAKFVGN